VTDLPPRSDNDLVTTRSSAAHVLILVALALAVSVFAWWTALAAFPHTGTGDGQQEQKVLEAARWSVLRYHEFPGWNPYECGGVPLWDNPTSVVGAPLAWLTLAVGTTWTIDAWYILHSALAFLSMWVLLRLDLRVSRVACFVGSAMWAWNGFFQQHYGAGHIPFASFAYFPLALFLWRRAEHELRAAVGLGCLVAWMMYEGGAYPLPHLAVVLGLESLSRAWPPRRSLAMAKAGAVVLGVSLFVGASRFIPVLYQLRIHTRHVDEIDHVAWRTLSEMFLSRNHPLRMPYQLFRWHEYGAYVGPFLLVLALIGVVTEGISHLWLTALLVVSFLLMLGDFARWAPWTVLHAHVFPFKELRVPSRFRAEVVMLLAAFAALAVDHFPRRLARFRRSLARGFVRSLLVLVSLLGVGDMLGVGLTRFAQQFTGAPNVSQRASSHFYLGGKGLAGLIDQPAQNRGRIKCWDEWGFEQGARLWDGDVAQVRPKDAAAARVLGIRRTQNSFTFSVDASTPTRILLDTSYDSGWHSTIGSVADDDRLLAVDVPAGRANVRVHYWPYGLTVGLVLSVASLLGVVAFFLWDARRRATGSAAREAVSGAATSTASPPSSS
jgi:hypothetical protein